MTAIEAREGRAGERTSAALARKDWRTALPFFYGWVMVGVSFIALGLSYSVWYSFSVFYVALLDEFGWSRAAAAGVYSLFVIVVGVAGAGAGVLVDRFGPGRVVALGAVVLAAGLVACSQISQLWQFYLLFGVLCAAGLSTVGWIPCVTTVNNWFSRRLGVALGVASAGIGLIGILTLVPVTQLLITSFGWRTAYLVLAAIILIGVAPMALLVLRGKPEELGLQRDGRRVPQDVIAQPGAAVQRPSRVVDRKWASRDWTVGSAMRTRRYWLLAAMLVSNNIAAQMIFVHQVAFLVDGGYDRLLAASIVGLVGLFSVGAKIGWGWVSDRLGRELTYTLGLSTMLIAVAALIATRLVSSPPVLYLFALSFALAYGVTSPVGPAVAADLFGGRRFGSIYGTLGVANGLGSATGAWFAGYVFDLTGSYLLAFGCAAASSLVSIAAVWMVAPRKVRVVPGRVG